MPLVTICRNDNTQGNKGLDAALSIVSHNIVGVVREALEVRNVVVVELPMKGDQMVFIDITCNFRDWRNKDLRIRHQKICGWVASIMRNNGVAPKSVNVRVMLAHVEYGVV